MFTFETIVEFLVLIVALAALFSIDLSGLLPS